METIEKRVSKETDGKEDKIGRKVDKIGRLLHFASVGDVQSVKMLLDEGLPVDSPDYDGRTAMHLAACGGHHDVIYFLLKEANPTAHVNPIDRWRKTPLADARWYEKLADARWYEKLKDKVDAKARYRKICELLNNNGGSTSSPFQIDPEELTVVAGTVKECKFGQMHVANWRGTNVSARLVDRTVPSARDSPKSDSEVMTQLSILQSCRHPNIVQFLGAVTNYDKNRSLVLVTENLPNGNLHDLLHSKKSGIQPKQAVAYALDIARGMNYLHQHKPEAVVHGELNPINLVQDAAGSLKVSGINMSKLIACICLPDRDYTEIQEMMYTCTSRAFKFFDYTRYVDPKFDREKPASKSDVFSFGMIVHEMFEGWGPASKPARVKPAQVASKPARVKPAQVAAAKGRNMFTMRASFPPKLKELLEECCDRDHPELRPSFEKIIERLEAIEELMKKTSWWAPKPLQSFINDFSYKSRVCFLGAKRLFDHSVAPSDVSLRGLKSWRGGRRGQKDKMIQISEE